MPNQALFSDVFAEQVKIQFDKYDWFFWKHKSSKDLPDNPTLFIVLESMR